MVINAIQPPNNVKLIDYTDMYAYHNATYCSIASQDYVRMYDQAMFPAEVISREIQIQCIVNNKIY